MELSLLNRFAPTIVDFCRRFSFAVVLFALMAALGMGYYITKTIKINTDINQLMGDGLEWRDLEKELENSFPQKTDRLVIVIDGINADSAEDAASRLSTALRSKPELFSNVTRPDSIPYFRKNGLLFLSLAHLNETLENLVKAQPFLGSLARDPSLRGLFSTMGLTTQGVARGDANYNEVSKAYQKMADTINSVIDNEDQKLPWQSLVSSQAPQLRDLRKFILLQPTLDYSDLSPGSKATKEVRTIIHELGLSPAHGVIVRLTGSVALNDQEFASVADGMGMAVIVSMLLVIALLYLALRSIRLILPIFITLVVGLIATTAFAMASVGSLNLISVAFAVMFVGIAVDFGIQFGVKFREERHAHTEIAAAMQSTARQIAGPLALAAASTTLGFLAFIPTDYRGVSELGIIASAGMIIAFILNLTLLPALLSLFNPPAEPEAIGYQWAKPIDNVLQFYRKELLVVITLVTLLCGGVAAQIRFDFDPLNLKDPNTESVSTMFSIMEDPDATPYTIEILSDNLDTARSLAGRIDALPEVDHTITLASFIPKNQEEKLAQIDDANFVLAPSLYPVAPLPPASDDEIIQAMQKTSAQLRALGDDKIEAIALANSIDKITQPAQLDKLQRLDMAMIAGMKAYIEQIKTLLLAQPVSLQDITIDLSRDWITHEGKARIEVYPKGNARDHKTLEAFTVAVRKIAPESTGTPISIQESGKTVLNAFIKAGLLAVTFIALLALVIFRNLGDVARLVAPLFIAGILTLATMVGIHLPLNFANIIALPLLLSLGVSYAIYFVSYWRAGKEAPLSSSMARAVLFSAATTLVAFGSLTLSAHPGTQGMGGLLTIALLYSLISTFLVLPVLLGKPR